MGQEWELKFSVADKETLDRIAAFAGGKARELTMSAVYFDTPTAQLQKRKWTLRLRKEGAESVLTMKTAGEGFARGEWEYPAETLDHCAHRLVALGAPQELLEILQEPLQPVCGAEFTRRALEIPLSQTKVELALDYGRLFKGEKELPLCELELELKEGETEAVLAYAETLQKTFSLTPESRSKFLRASTL